MYLIDCLIYFENLFHSFVIKYKIDNSTFIKSPAWLISKKCTINPENNDNKGFQYSVTLSLYYQEIGTNPFRVSRIKPFINLNWENINFLPQEQDYKIFEMNKKSIAHLFYTHIVMEK